MKQASGGKEKLLDKINFFFPKKKLGKNNTKITKKSEKEPARERERESKGRCGSLRGETCGNSSEKQKKKLIEKIKLKFKHKSS